VLLLSVGAPQSLVNGRFVWPPEVNATEKLETTFKAMVDMAKNGQLLAYYEFSSNMGIFFLQT